MNPYLPREAKIIDKKKETGGMFLFTLQFKHPPYALDFNPGQFVLAGIPGFGESAFDICSGPAAFCPLGQQRSVLRGHSVLSRCIGTTAIKQTFQICVRNVGVNTAKMVDLKINDSIFMRGPYGNGFPIEKLHNKSLLLVGGGTGIIVIRGLMRYFLTKNLKSKIQNPDIQIFYGARNWNSMLFRNEFKIWKKIADLHLILEELPERPACPRGLITQLFEITKLIEKPTIILCGPPVMYKFCLEKIQEKLETPSNRIYLSLERRMHCGIGVCQHCAIGNKYVCKDGPVFTYEEIKSIGGAL